MKAAIRKEMLAKRGALSEAEQSQDAEKLAEILATWFAEYVPNEQGKIVAGYAAARGELDVFPGLSSLAKKGHRLCLPCVIESSRELTFRHWQPEDVLEKGAYNINQPSDSTEMLVPDIVCVPLVAADVQCNRLGSGGGYYDTTIAALKKQNPNIITIGIAYDFQLLDSVPTEAHDVPLDYIITPTRRISCDVADERSED